MKNILISLAVAAAFALPFAASAHGTWSSPVSCTITAPAGGGLVYGSGPLAPGWNVSKVGGGVGSSETWVPQGTPVSFGAGMVPCPFFNGCMIQ